MKTEENRNGWTDERNAKCVKLWNDGLSAAEIAVRLGGGLSRSAVLGKLHRLGLSGRDARLTSAVRKKAAKRARATQLGKRAAENASQAQPKPQPKQSPMKAVWAKEPPKEKMPNEDVFAVRPDAKRLVDLNFEDCRWPFAKFDEVATHFCGHERVSGLAYCEEHARIAFAPVQPRRKFVPGVAGGVPMESEGKATQDQSRPAVAILEPVK